MDLLKKQINNIVDPYAERMLNLDWSDKDLVASWLSQTFYFVRYNLKLIAYSAAFTPPAEYEDYNRYVEHMREESGHEFLASRDLQSLGYDLKDFRETFSTKSLYATQFFNIDKHGHEALMGYAMALEFLADKVCLKINEKVKADHGMSSSFLKVHGEEDEGHIDSAIDVLNQWSPGQIDVVLKICRETCEAYQNFLDSCLQLSSNMKEKRELGIAA